MNYPYIVPPFEVKDFEEMSPKEARVHFDWFVGIIPDRMRLLEARILESFGDGGFELDYTKDSLLKVWTWYQKNVQIEEKSEEELAREKSLANEITVSYIEAKKITPVWMAVALDISTYFAECMVKNNPSLKWDVVTKPKSFAYVNKPVVVGYKYNMALDASNIILVQTKKIIEENTSQDALVVIFENWESLI